jgi:hypothetical protein
MGRINHRIGRLGQWVESRQRQLVKPGRIIFELDSIRCGHGIGDLFEHSHCR